MFPFVEESLELALGVETHHCLQQCAFLMRAYPVFGGGDMPAIAMVMLMKGPNGISPCHMCKILAIIKQHTTTYYVPLQPPRGRHHLPSYDPLNLPLRDHDGFLKDAREVQLAATQAEAEALAKASGIKGLPLLSHIPSHVVSGPTRRAAFHPRHFDLLLQSAIKN